MIGKTLFDFLFFCNSSCTNISVIFYGLRSLLVLVRTEIVIFLRSTTFSCVNTFLRDDMNKNEEAKTLQKAYTSLKVLFLLSCHFRAITNRHFLFIKEAMRRNVCISVILTLSMLIMHMAQYKY